MAHRAFPSRLRFYLLSSFAKLLGVTGVLFVLPAVSAALTSRDGLLDALRLFTAATALGCLAVLLYDTAERRLLELHRQFGSPPLTGFERLYGPISLRLLAALAGVIGALTCCAAWIDWREQPGTWPNDPSPVWLFILFFGIFGSVALIPIICVVHLSDDLRQPLLFCLALLLALSPFWIVALAVALKVAHLREFPDV